MDTDDLIEQMYNDVARIISNYETTYNIHPAAITGVLRELQLRTVQFGSSIYTYQVDVDSDSL